MCGGGGALSDVIVRGTCVEIDRTEAKLLFRRRTGEVRLRHFFGGFLLDGNRMDFFFGYCSQLLLGRDGTRHKAQ